MCGPIDSFTERGHAHLISEGQPVVAVAVVEKQNVRRPVIFELKRPL